MGNMEAINMTVGDDIWSHEKTSAKKKVTAIIIVLDANKGEKKDIYLALQ